jgi:3-deoxy-D-manno-octulosonic-acid transferase
LFKLIKEKLLSVTASVFAGEGMAAIPVIKECVKWRPDLNILLTTTTMSAL